MLADIFLGKITKWNDPAIAKLNPGVKLPGDRHHGRAPLRRLRHDLHLGGLPRRRSRRSGRRRSASRRRSTGRSGVGGKGNEGVAGLVKQTPGAIGYVELIYALQNKIDYGAVQNTAGEFVDGVARVA